VRREGREWLDPEHEPPGDTACRQVGSLSYGAAGPRLSAPVSRTAVAARAPRTLGGGGSPPLHGREAGGRPAHLGRRPVDHLEALLGPELVRHMAPGARGIEVTNGDEAYRRTAQPTNVRLGFALCAARLVALRYGSRDAVAWFCAPNEVLGGATPAGVIRSGDPELGGRWVVMAARHVVVHMYDPRTRRL
jgi:hypothetical protein